jgi:hypothetical protein
MQERLARSPFSLELDSVKLGVPSVQVGVEPSIDVGGVQASAPREPYALLFDDVDSFVKCVSKRMSDILFEELSSTNKHVIN